MPDKRYPRGLTPLKEPGSFEIRATVKQPNGTKLHLRRHLRHSTLKAAIRERKKLVEEARHGEADKRRRTGDEALTLSAYVKHLLPLQKAKGQKESTLARKVEALDRAILPEFGDMYVRAIRRRDVEEWLARKSREKSRKGAPYRPASINSWLRIFKGVVSAAYREYEWGPSPLSGIEALREPPRSRDNPNSLTLEELRKLLAAAHRLYPQHFALIFVGFVSGMRWSELSALRWSDLDEREGVIHVERAQWHGHVSTPKTGEPRTVALLPEMVTVLKQHRQRLADEELPHGDGDLVFPSERGGFSYSSRLRKPFDQLCKECGITKHLTPHGMRRTFNNLLRLQGVDRQVLRSLTGHSSEAMTGRYSTVEAAEQQRAVAPLVQLVTGLVPEVVDDP